MESLTLSGVVGSVRWGHRTAATLNDVVATGGRGRWSFRATVADADLFAVDQAPLVLAVPFQGGEWRWQVMAVHLEGRSITGALADVFVVTL